MWSGLTFDTLKSNCVYAIRLIARSYFLNDAIAAAAWVRAMRFFVAFH